VINGFNIKDKERQIRPILARQVWVNESANPVVPCGRDLSLAVAFVENKLTRSERKDFQSHLLDCRHCRQFVSSEVRLQRPIFEEPRLVQNSRPAFFEWFKMQWVAAAASLILAAGVTSFLVINHNPASHTAAIPASVSPASPVAANRSEPIVPAAIQNTSPRELVPLNGAVAIAEHENSIDFGGIVADGRDSASGGASVINPISNPAGLIIDVKDNKDNKDLHGSPFKVDASTVNPLASTLAGMTPPPSAGDQVGSTEYQVKVETANLNDKPIVSAGRITEIQTGPLSTNLRDMDQASINIPTSSTDFVGHDSEVVIISHPLVPWTTSTSSRPGLPVNESFVSKNSPYYEAMIAFSGKLFNQVDKVWVDQEFTTGSNMPVVKVKVKSQQAQDLISANPGLKPFLSMHKQMVVVFEGKVYMTY
jgi:hypothetical protein